MQVTKEGIEINKAELTALLAFAGKEQYSTVRFRVPPRGGRLTATATDGSRLVHAKAHEPAEEDTGFAGDWGVPAEHLEGAKRALGAGEVCVLQVKKHHMDRAVIRDVVSGRQQSTVVFPEAADTQTSFPAVDQITPVENLKGSWFAVQGRFLRDLNVLSRACGKHPITLHPPKDPIKPFGFSARGDTASWQGVIMPVEVVGPGDYSIDDEDDDGPPPDRLNPDLDEAIERLGDPDGTGTTKVTMKGPDGTVTDISAAAKRVKAKKAAAKKPKGS